MVLAVAVVDRVLGDHQPRGDHQVVDGGSVRMAGDHVAADGESVELVLPLVGIRLDLVHRPGLDPVADLRDPHRVGVRDGMVVEARDRLSHPGCRGGDGFRVRGSRVHGLGGAAQVQTRRAQTGGAAQDPLQGGVRRSHRGAALLGMSGHRLARRPVPGDGHVHRHGTRGREGDCGADGDSGGDGEGGRAWQSGPGIGRGGVGVGPRGARGGRRARLPGRRPGIGHPWLLAEVGWAVPGPGHVPRSGRVRAVVTDGRVRQPCQRPICTFSSTPSASGTRIAAE